MQSTRRYLLSARRYPANNKLHLHRLNLSRACRLSCLSYNVPLKHSTHYHQDSRWLSTSREEGEVLHNGDHDYSGQSLIELSLLEKARSNQQKERLVVSILGPSNAGKSTLFNRLMCKEANKSFRLSSEKSLRKSKRSKVSSRKLRILVMKLSL